LLWPCVRFSHRTLFQVHFEITNPTSGTAVFAVSTNQPRRMFAKPKRGTLAAGASVNVAVTLDGDSVPTSVNEYKASQLAQGESYQAGALLVRSAQGSPPSAASSSSSSSSPSEVAPDAAAMISKAVAAPSAVSTTLPVLVTFPGLEATSAGAGSSSAVPLPVSEAELLDRHIDAVRRSHHTIKSSAAPTKRLSTKSSKSGDGSTESTTAGDRDDLLKHLAAEASGLKEAYREQLKASLSLTAERDRLAWRVNETADALLSLTDPNHVPLTPKKKSSPSPSKTESGSLEPSTSSGGKAANGVSQDDDSEAEDSGFSPAQVLTILLLSFFTGRLFPLR